MTLFKRHIGRRVAGVGIGVALLMLGLAAPAFAAGPTVTSFTPTSGPAGCIVDVTGTGFKASTAVQTHVFFLPPASTVGTEATSKFVLSDTELWAEVPGLAAGVGYTIRVDNLLGTGTASTATFTFTAGAGTCAPTVTSFTPTCGAAGDVFKITGTNLLGPGEAGGLVEFAPFAGTPPAANGVDATPTNPDISEPTVLQVTVPTGVADGPIQVTTFGATKGGAVLSSTLFQTPPPDCPSPTGHTRSISLKLKDKLVAKGTVKSTETTPFTDCAASVPVKIQRKVSGSWKTVGKTTTSDTGAYSKKIKNKKGKYRSIAVKTTLTGGEVCLKAKSPVRTH
jgi:IPT/TIG domain